MQHFFDFDKLTFSLITFFNNRTTIKHLFGMYLFDNAFIKGVYPLCLSTTFGFALWRNNESKAFALLYSIAYKSNMQKKQSSLKNFVC